MFCQKCGKEINDEAVICIGCGCPANQPKDTTTSQPAKNAKESDGLANCALLFAFLVPIVGIILGIVGICKYQTPKYKNRCITSIVVSIIMWIVSFIILVLAFSF